VTANLRFVISYVKRFQGHGLDLSELVAIGNEGLLKAVRKFDPAHGVKFISYAVWWVRQCVLKALAEQTRTVRIPLNQNAALMKMAKVESLLSQELGRSPTDSETAQVLDEPVETIRQARWCLPSRCRSTRRWSATTRARRPSANAWRAAAPPTSKTWWTPACARNSSPRFPPLPDPREQRILSLYYGLEEGSEALTLEGIGAMLGVTRERVRQIRERAFEKLRNAPGSEAPDLPAGGGVALKGVREPGSQGIRGTALLAPCSRSLAPSLDSVHAVASAAFPLRVVLFPGALLPLHIFEPRYQQLLSDVSAGEHRFGLLPPASMADSPRRNDRLRRAGARGAAARRGRSNIVVSGERRFRFLEPVPAATPYHQGPSKDRGSSRRADPSGAELLRLRRSVSATRWPSTRWKTIPSTSSERCGGGALLRGGRPAGMELRRAQRLLELRSVTERGAAAARAAGAGA
jgi:RNA polymerase primary sigma factor